MSGPVIAGVTPLRRSERMHEDRDEGRHYDGQRRLGKEARDERLDAIDPLQELGAEAAAGVPLQIGRAAFRAG